MKQVREVFEIRQIIEGYVTQALGKRLTPSDLMKLDRLIKKQEEQAARNDNESFIETDREFHVFLASRMDNQRLESILQNLRDQMHLMGIYALKNRERAEQVLAEHIEILKALKEADARKAQKVMIRPLKKTETIIVDMIREERQGRG